PRSTTVLLVWWIVVQSSLFLLAALPEIKHFVCSSANTIARVLAPSATTAGTLSCRLFLQAVTVPCGSASISAVFLPSSSPCTARDRASMDLPTSPFCAKIETTIILVSLCTSVLAYQSISILRVIRQGY